MDRGLFGAVLVAAYVVWRDKTAPAPTGFRLGWPGWLLASVGSLASLAVAAFHHLKAEILHNL